MDLSDIAICVGCQIDLQLTHFTSNTKFGQEETLAFIALLPSRNQQVHIEMINDLCWRHDRLALLRPLLVLEVAIADLKQEVLVSLRLSHITLLLYRVWKRTRLEIGKEKVTHGNKPLLFNNHCFFIVLRSANFTAKIRGFSGLCRRFFLLPKLVFLVDPLRIIAEGYFKDWTCDLYFDLILALCKLVHLHTLLYMAIKAGCEGLFELFGLVTRLRLQIFDVEKEN